MVLMTLTPDSTPQSFAAGFFGKLFAGASINMFMSGCEPESKE